MKLEYLTYLADLNQTHSISRTAERFYMAQQSLSDKIKSLETELKIQLLYRSSSGVTLTEAAQSLLEIAMPFLQKFSLWQNSFAISSENDEAALPAQVTIYFSSAYVGIILPKVINIFHKEYPSISLLIREKSYNDIFDAIACDTNALAFLSINDEYFKAKITAYPNLHHQLLSTDSVIGCISTKSPDLLDKPFLTEEDFRFYNSIELNVIPLSEDTHPAASAYYRGCNVDFARRSIQQNDTIAVMPRRVYDALFDNSYFTYKPISEATQTVCNTVLYSQSPLHPALSYFIQLMAARL